MLGNWFKTSILMAAIMALFGVIGAALEKIQRYAQGLPMPTAEQHPETAQMIVNSLSGDGIKSLFSTHPATEERVARLVAMAQSVA